MADSSCIRCNNNNFEMVKRSVAYAKNKFTFVQCAHCGCVVGVLEGARIADLIIEQNKVIKKMAEKMGVDVGERLGFE